MKTKYVDSVLNKEQSKKAQVGLTLMGCNVFIGDVGYGCQDLEKKERSLNWLIKHFEDYRKKA